MDIKALGDEHAFCDNPLMIQGAAKIVCFGENRMTVTARAQLESGGRTYFVTGWIDNVGLTALTRPGA